MNIAEFTALENRLGRPPTWQEIHKAEVDEMKVIRKFVNHHLWTDVKPYEVIKTCTPNKVLVRAMRTEQIKFPQDFHKGGFVGHYSDNRSGQDYEYISDETNPIIAIRWSNAREVWQSPIGERFYMSDYPYKFYDYNF
jgi:hypothetical protein